MIIKQFLNHNVMYICVCVYHIELHSTNLFITLLDSLFLSCLFILTTVPNLLLTSLCLHYTTGLGQMYISRLAKAEAKGSGT